MNDRPTYTLPAGTLVYHGTAVPVDFEELDDPAWVSTSKSVADQFKGWHGDDNPRVLTYRTRQDLNLTLIQSPEDLNELVLDLGLDPDPLDVDDLRYEFCASTNTDGWIIPNNYPDGDDILLCRASWVLDFVESSSPFPEDEDE